MIRLKYYTTHATVSLCPVSAISPVTILGLLQQIKIKPASLLTTSASDHRLFFLPPNPLFAGTEPADGYNQLHFVAICTPSSRLPAGSLSI